MRASDFTFIVKSFERPDALAKLIASLRKYYPKERVIVADDSKDMVPPYSPEYHTIRMPFDSGLSAGRNAALAQVKTPYFILLDDDFIFTPRTRVQKLVSIAERCGHDIVGGGVIEKGELRRYEGSLVRRGDTLHYIPEFKSNHADHMTCDMVLNFFAGKTSSVKKIGWDPDLKLAEHTDFFWRAKGILSVAYCPGVKIMHTKERNPAYTVYRQRGKEMFKIFMRKNGLKKTINFNGVVYRDDA